MKITSLYKNINQKSVLKNIDLTIKNGEIIGVIGRNGAGKTTLFRCLTNQYLPDQGSITINGNDTQTFSKLREKIFYIDEQANFLSAYPLSTIQRFYEKAYPNFDHEYYLELITTFHLNSHARYRSLSKGMQGVFKVILGIASNAEYLLLDEPFDGLDAMIKKEIIQLILVHMATTGNSILITSHNLNELETIIDRSLFLANGEIRYDVYLESLREYGQKLQLAFSKNTLPEVVHKHGQILSTQRNTFTVFFPQYSDTIRQQLIDEAPLLMEETAFSLEDLLQLTSNSKINIQKKETT